MYKNFKFIIFIIVINTILFGAYKNVDEAEQYALKWFQSNSLSKGVVRTINKVETKSYNGKEVFHVVNLYPTGFMIIAADDNVSPVLAYSEESNIEINSENPGLKAFLNQYSKYVYNASQVGIQLESDLWKNVITAKAMKDTVEPLIETIWDQGWPYNKFCPIDSTAGSYTNYRVWAGCVATTMSQLMKYHNYPDSGRGTYSYHPSGYDSLSVNLDTIGYDWASMRKVIFSHSPDTLVDPIAELMYHCGVVMDMGYGPDGSGAFSQFVDDAMVEYFDYSPEIKFLLRSSYSDEKWKNILKAELSDSRPIYYAGNDGEAGHAFVCDGVEKRKMGDFFHFNWGWSGSGNGYFTIDNMTFNYGQDIVINFAPRGQIAKFDADLSRGALPLTVSFTDLTDDENINSWEWDFDGDGIVDSYEQHPSWTYEEFGDYSVVLKVSNDSISYQKTLPDFIEVISKDEIYGSLLTDRVLEAGKVKVLNNVTVPEGVTLTILPGVEMEFQGNYELKVDGNIVAEGLVDDPIVFTVADTTGFADYNGVSGGWKGIFLTGKANDTTSFINCKFEYVKKGNAIRSINNNNLFLSQSTFSNNIGSALGIWLNKEKRIKIDKCLFENNLNHGAGTYANWGSAIVGYFANLDITNSIFVNNKMLKAGLINLASSSSLNLVNCTVTDNIPSENTQAVLDISVSSEVNIQNSILWNDGTNEINFTGDNIASITYSDLESGLAEITGNAPEYVAYEANINVDPQFADEGYALNSWSQCIDRGILPGDTLIIDSLDYRLDFRLYASAIDLGAVEYPGEPEQLNIGFIADIDSGEFPLEVTFTDTTKTDNIVSIKWDFENDGTWDAFDEVEVKHIYQRQGIYSVSMLAMAADSIPFFVLAKDIINVSGEAVAIDSKDPLIPGEFYLEQNYPNPFNPSTTISYGIPKPANISLEIYNILGQKIITLDKSQKAAGHYDVVWNGMSQSGKLIPSGIYIYSLKGEGFSIQKKMFFMK